MCSLPAKSKATTFVTSPKIGVKHQILFIETIAFFSFVFAWCEQGFTVLRVLTPDVQPVVDVEGAEAVRRLAGVAPAVLRRHVLDLQRRVHHPEAIPRPVIKKSTSWEFNRDPTACSQQYNIVKI